MDSACWFVSSIFGSQKIIFAFPLVPASMCSQQMAAVLRENVLPRGGVELEGKSLQVLEQKLIMLLA